MAHQRFIRRMIGLLLPTLLLAGCGTAPGIPDLPVAPTAAPDVDSAAHEHSTGGSESRVVAPMPGTVLRVEVAPGDRVEARRHLLVLEAMKMETPLTAPFDATVTAVHVQAGDRVAGGALLVELETD